VSRDVFLGNKQRREWQKERENSEEVNVFALCPADRWRFGRRRDVVTAARRDGVGNQ
jgi:hypothetical protein